MNERIASDDIQHLEPNEIFVFGSNESGSHGKGAAKQALGWGAVWGQGEGLQGRTYGIPTKGRSVRKTLSINEIKPYVDRFIQCAKEHPELTFLVTQIGCGLARLEAKNIAPLFKDAIHVQNIHLPNKFWHKLSKYIEEEKDEGLL